MSKLRDLAVEIGLEVRRADLNAIRQGVLAHYRDCGKAPLRKSGDCGTYVPGFSTWESVGDHLSRAGLSLRDVSDEVIQNEWVERVRQGVRRYFQDHGKGPIYRSGVSTNYVAGSRNWQQLARQLRDKGLTLEGLRDQECPRIGKQTRKLHRPVVPLETFTTGLLGFYRDNGYLPSGVPGDASPYVPFNSWITVDSYLQRRHNCSLATVKARVRAEGLVPADSLRRRVYSDYAVAA